MKPQDAKFPNTSFFTNAGRLAALAAGMLLATCMASAAVITTMTVSGGTGFSAETAPDRLIGPGITASGDVTTWTHTNTSWPSDVHWLTVFGSDSWVEFDLGGTYTVGTAHIWNFNTSEADRAARSASTVRLIFSENSTFGDADDSFQDLSLSPGTGLTTYTGEHIALTQVSDVTNIRLEILTNGGNTFAAMSEVRFSAIPEPSSFALVAGMFGLTCVRRRRRG
ncbi:hypothetical protein [Haloferula sp. A504]|uniref:hypothetical protein n=1 Tax=Haloferula sp. A504 TaxID=3373601 RepID=UPI0031C833B9|nr:hypothetical protein [Verrucomicrobiaceae bacterium E54]